MSGINGIQPGSKPVEVQTSEEPAPTKTETSTPKETAKDTFETPKEKTFFNFASGPTNTSDVPPGEAMTAKGLAYLKMKEAQKKEPGEAKTAKGEAFLKWKEAQDEKGAPGEARTAKGQAYQKMLQAEAANILKESAAVQPGDAPRTKKFSGDSN